jgi:N-acetylglucosamine kinase-like BadF-type ATPase
MYVGTDAADPIIIVHANKTAEALHPGVLSPAMHIFASGTGSILYAVKGTSTSGIVGTSGKIYKINPLKTLAPYYGPQ